MKRDLWLILVTALVFLACPVTTIPQPQVETSTSSAALSRFGRRMPEIEEEEGINGFGLALRRLNNLGSVLYITAHPDDENNALLARLSRGEGYRVGLLTLTRGDGGQNEIGGELFKALGVLRTEELAAVHRFDGAQQFFTRAYEFGYSFSVEETFEKWGRPEVLDDIVRVIRAFRPTVVLTLYPTGAGGGQHHQASAQLAEEACRLAGDPQQFPQHLSEGLRPWRPLRLFQAAGIGMGGGVSGGDVRIPLGVYDPLLGESYAEFGAKARSRHRSQGMNVLPQPGPMTAAFFLATSTVDSSAIDDSFFDQIDVSLSTLAGYDRKLDSSISILEGYVNWATQAFARSDYPAAVKAVMTGLDLVNQMLTSAGDAEARFLLERKREDFLMAAEKGAFLYADALVSTSSDGVMVPGEEITVQVRIYPRAEVPVQVEDVRLEGALDWGLVSERKSPSLWEFQGRVPEAVNYSAPYWYLAGKAPSRFAVEPGFSGTEENIPPPLKAVIQYRTLGIAAVAERAVQHRRFDLEWGLDSWMDLKVAPRYGVHLSPPVAIVRLNDPQPREFEVSVHNYRPSETSASIRLNVPSGWKVFPPAAGVQFRAENELQVRRFTVTPPPGVRLTSIRVGAEVAAEDGRFGEGIEVVAYPHIQTRHILSPASVALHVLDVGLPGDLEVGYVMGVGDDVGLATEQLGARVTYLQEDDLRSGDLGRYDVIVTGVRAYLARPDLIANNNRILEYVENGGHLVVQYNKYEYLQSQFAPYPLTISRPHDRVTVEDSAVTVLDPGHPVFNHPNRIRPTDWDGWVQERGLYFLGEWDSRYQPLLELRDPWPYNSDPKRGSLVYATYGKGSFVYTGLAFFRQLPEGVPGAYRLWANLISQGRLRQPR